MVLINYNVFDILDGISPQLAMFGTLILFAAVAAYTCVQRAYKDREDEE